MNMTVLEVEAGYEVLNPPLLEMQPGGPHHQLGRFFTVVALENGGAMVYDGAYDSGFSTVHLTEEILSQLRVQKIEKTTETRFADLMTALGSSAAAANEQRVLVAEHNGADAAVEASHRFLLNSSPGKSKGWRQRG